MDLKTSNVATYIFRFANEKMWKRGIVMTIVCMCVILQMRNFNRYRVERRRKHKEAATYLNSDVCADPITRSELGNFNLCEKAEHIVNERPTEAAFYDILNDWYPCGHGRCEGFADWCAANIHWFMMILLVVGMLVYFKYVEHQRNVMFTKMVLPTRLMNQPIHVD
jgi:hypothetical protein